jgi:hypothetical protein
MASEASSVMVTLADFNGRRVVDGAILFNSTFIHTDATGDNLRDLQRKLGHQPYDFLCFVVRPPLKPLPDKRKRKSDETNNVIPRVAEIQINPPVGRTDVVMNGSRFVLTKAKEEQVRLAVTFLETERLLSPDENDAFSVVLVRANFKCWLSDSFEHIFGAVLAQNEWKEMERKVDPALVSHTTFTPRITFTTTPTSPPPAVPLPAAAAVVEPKPVAAAAVRIATAHSLAAAAAAAVVEGPARTPSETSIEEADVSPTTEDVSPIEKITKNYTLMLLESMVADFTLGADFHCREIEKVTCLDHLLLKLWTFAHWVYCERVCGYNHLTTPLGTSWLHNTAFSCEAHVLLQRISRNSNAPNASSNLHQCRSFAITALSAESPCQSNLLQKVLEVGVGVQYQILFSQLLKSFRVKKMLCIAA